MVDWIKNEIIKRSLRRTLWYAYFRSSAIDVFSTMSFLSFFVTGSVIKKMTATLTSHNKRAEIKKEFLIPATCEITPPMSGPQIPPTISAVWANPKVTPIFFGSALAEILSSLPPHNRSPPLEMPELQTVGIRFDLYRKKDTMPQEARTPGLPFSFYHPNPQASPKKDS